MRTSFRTFFLLLLSVFGISASYAQNAPQAFSLKQAVDYALQNQERMKIAQNETKIANAKIGEIRSIGLPQINLGAEIGNNFIQQKTLIDPSSFGPQIEGYQLTQADIQKVNDGSTDVVLRP